ncbi:hypothetical protein P7K49_013464 [Saguinus oedipus]|uniref:Uncharacterized protein n=1 Tax=Saguinus oedipus TaxID=9490 RepID=A0ABQ9VG01_SAGOE|nr:hypothetical protein P7K49_013464 [Saguinus oedipus]
MWSRTAPRRPWRHGAPAFADHYDEFQEVKYLSYRGAGDTRGASLPSGFSWGAAPLGPSQAAALEPARGVTAVGTGVHRQPLRHPGGYAGAQVPEPGRGGLRRHAIPDKLTYGTIAAIGQQNEERLRCRPARPNTRCGFLPLVPRRGRDGATGPAAHSGGHRGLR